MADVTQVTPRAFLSRLDKAWVLFAAVLLVIGGLNWGLVGFFGFDLVATPDQADAVLKNLAGDGQDELVLALVIEDGSILWQARRGWSAEDAEQIADELLRELITAAGE